MVVVLVVVVAVAAVVPVLQIARPAMDLRQIGWFFRTSLLLKQNLSGALIYKTDGRGAVLIGVGRYLGTSMAWSPPFLPWPWRNSGFCGAPSENHCTSEDLSKLKDAAIPQKCSKCHSF